MVAQNSQTMSAGQCQVAHTLGTSQADVSRRIRAIKGKFGKENRSILRLYVILLICELRVSYYKTSVGRKQRVSGEHWLDEHGSRLGTSNTVNGQARESNWWWSLAGVAGAPIDLQYERNAGSYLSRVAPALHGAVIACAKSLFTFASLADSGSEWLHELQARSIKSLQVIVWV